MCLWLKSIEKIRNLRWPGKKAFIEINWRFIILVWMEQLFNAYESLIMQFF